MTTADDVWAQLRKGAKDESRTGWIRRRLPSQSIVNFWAGLRTKDGSPALMLEVPDSIFPQIRELPKTGGLSVEVHRLQTEDQGFSTLIALLRDSSYEDIFASYCEDVVRRLAICASAAEAAETLLLRLRRWQQFLDAAREGLSADEQIGLFGELHVLSAYLLPKIGTVAIACWFGPDQAAKDFILPGQVAVEVKSTAARTIDVITISSKYQLDDTGFERLYLVALRFEKPPSGGSTLNELVEALRGQLAGSPEQLLIFNSKLVDGGYHDRHRSRYDAPRYKFAATAAYRVADGFPRIVTSDIPPAISDVTYGLRLGQCSAHAVPESEVFGVVFADA